MKRITKFIINSLKIFLFNIKVVYAYSTAICPPINSISCSEMGMGWTQYTSSVTPGDWRGVMFTTQCASSIKFSYGTILAAPLGGAVTCFYKTNLDDNGYMMLQSAQYPYYKKTGDQNCNAYDTWNDPTQPFDYGLQQCSSKK